MKLSFHGRLLAAVAGCAFAAGGLTILLGKDLLHPYDWAAGQWITILTVFGTIAAGHLLHDAYRGRHLFACVGFLALFVSGTVLVVCQSVGRQAETFEASTMSAEATNKAIADKTSDLEQARARKAYADAQVQKETGRRGCGRNCLDWQRNAKDVAIVISQLEKEIAALGPMKPVNAQAARMADMAALFGIDRSKALVTYTMLQPLLWCLFFEIGSIVSLGFAFRQGKRPLVAANDQLPSQINTFASVADSLQTSFPAEFDPDDPPKGKRRKPLPRNVIEFSNHPVFKALEKNGGSVTSHRQLAELMGIDEGAATRRRHEVEDRLLVTRHGKQLRIALRA